MAGLFKDQLGLKKRRRRRFLILGLSGGILGAVIGLIYLFFFSGMFEVKAIEVNGRESIDEGELLEIINDWLDVKQFWVERRTNSLFVDLDELKKVLVSRFLKIESITISRRLNKIELSLVEYEPIGIWCLETTDSAAKCFFFNKNGIVYEETGPSTGFLVTLVRDGRLRNVNLGSQIASPLWLENLTLAKKTLADIGIATVEFSIPKDSPDSIDEFQIKTEEGWLILLSGEGDISNQLNSLLVILGEKITPAIRAKLQYIDLRIPGRVYYK